MRLSMEKSLLEQMTIEQFRQNLALLKAEEIEMPKKWVLELLNTIEALQQENEQLWVQVAQYREACILGYSYLSLLFHRADIKNWNEVGMCSVKDIKHVLNELESTYKGGNTPTEYHNPADVEALRKAREALCKAISELKVHCKYFDQTPEEDACIEMYEAVVEIDKVIGGKEDV